MFDLGQPNLVLLAHDAVRLLAAAASSAPGWREACLRSPPPSRFFRSPCFPIWSGAGNGRRPRAWSVFLVIFLFVLPAPFRGFQHNVAELKTWYQGMVGSSSEKGFGQRDEQNWSWVNQSIIAVTHRLTRPVNYNQDDPRPSRRAHECRRSRFQDGELDRARDIAGDRAWLSRGDAAGVASDAEKSDAEELGILFCLMTVASPLARQYYFMWLFFPMTVLIHRAAYDPRPAVAGRHLGRAGDRGRPDVPVAAGVSERSAGLWQQSRGDRRARCRAGLAHPASARGCDRRRLASGGRRTTT